MSCRSVWGQVNDMAVVGVAIFLTQGKNIISCAEEQVNPVLFLKRDTATMKCLCEWF